MRTLTRILLASLPVAAALLGGCTADDSMTGTVKPNPEQAKRYQKGGPGGNPTGPQGGGTAGAAAGAQAPD